MAQDTGLRFEASWFPFWGGERFRFFQPVFNVADAAISVGTVSLLLFHRSFFVTEEEKSEKRKGKEDVVVSGNEEE